MWVGVGVGRATAAAAARALAALVYETSVREPVTYAAVAASLVAAAALAPYLPARGAAVAHPAAPRGDRPARPFGREHACPTSEHRGGPGAP
jgi:hypothetical protein